MSEPGAAGRPPESGSNPEPAMPERPAESARTGDGEGSVRVVGTAHVSRESVEEVRRVVAEDRPDVVAVELDADRYRQLQGGTPDDVEAADLLRGDTVFQFLAYWMLSYVQSRMGERFDVEPGAEMRAAIDAAGEVSAGVALVDRDIQVTIRRFWDRMTLFEKLRTGTALAVGVADPPVVAVVVGAAVGLLLGPVAGAVAGAAGVPPAVAGALAAGGVVALAVGYGLFEVALAVGGGDGGGDPGGGSGPEGGAGAGTGPDGGGGPGLAVPVAAVGGTAAGLGVALTGTGAGAVANALAGTVYLVGGAVATVGAGVLLGGAVGAVLLATGRGTVDVDEAGMEEFDPEELTDADVVTALIEEFREFSPGGAAALIDERDAYIAHNLLSLRDRGYRVVAVVGAGHREGIERYLDRPEELPPMAELTGTGTGRRLPFGVPVAKLAGVGLTLGFVAFFGLLVLGGADRGFLVELFLAWFLFNGVFAFGLAKLAGARWSSAAVGGAVAWLTSVNPLLAPGWFAGYVELRGRPVNVADVARLNEIVADETAPLREVVGRMLDVPLFRLIAVVALTNVGSMAASFLFPFVVLPLVAPGGDVTNVGALLLDGARNGARILWEAVA